MSEMMDPRDAGGFSMGDMGDEDFEGEEEELSPEHEALAETLAENYETAIDKAEACIDLAGQAEDDEESIVLLNLAKFYAGLEAASRENRKANDMDAFESIVSQLEGTPAYAIAKKVEELEGGGEEGLDEEMAEYHAYEEE